MSSQQGPQTPPVPEPEESASAKSGGAVPPSASAAFDAPEAPVSSATLQADNSLLKLRTQEYEARQTVLCTAVIMSVLLFIAGFVTFWIVCYKTQFFGWDKITLLIAFFTPATIILGVLIRAVYTSKKEDTQDALPHAEIWKAIAELSKSIGKP